MLLENLILSMLTEEDRGKKKRIFPLGEIVRRLKKKNIEGSVGEIVKSMQMLLKQKKVILAAYLDLKTAHFAVRLA